MNQDFKRSLIEHANKKQHHGKIIILSGISGSGKTVVADMLVNNHNFAFINKYVTRPFRPYEIKASSQGKSLGIKPVYGRYNDGDKSIEEQEQSVSLRKQNFIKLGLPLSYVNYDNYYGFSLDEINNYIDYGRNAVIIVNDMGLVQDLKNIYGNDAIACYVHRSNPKNKDIFMELAKQRKDSLKSAEKRYQKSIKTFDSYINHTSLYDHTILNIENGTENLEKMLNSLITRTSIDSSSNTKSHTNEAKIYAFIGNPGSGKDEALETIKIQGILHSIILPKHTSRHRKPDDGEELICPGDANFDMDSCDIQYSNFGTTYGINSNELRQRLNDGVSSSIVVSNPSALKKLNKKFPEQLVKIYIHGLSKEEYIIQQKNNLNDEYVQKRIADYDKANQLYYNQWLDFNHVIINNDNITDLKIQIDGIMKFYEKGRNLTVSSYKDYMAKANKYISRFSQSLSGR